MNILCPDCGRTWVTISMEHDCWIAGHVKNHTKCFICRAAESVEEEVEHAAG